MERSCQQCRKELTKEWQTTFCSRPCYWQSLVGSTGVKKGFWKNCLGCGVSFYLEQNKKDRKYHDRNCFAASLFGKPSWSKGKKFSDSHRKNLSESHVGLVPSTKGKKRPNLQGVNSGNWKGGITSEIRKVRNSLELKLWREEVFKRDDWTCQRCLSRGGVLHADHILPFAIFHKLRFEPDNGQTLCVDCHKTKTARFMREYKKGFFRGRSLEDWKIMSPSYAYSK
jgi:hypothetical protein